MNPSVVLIENRRWLWIVVYSRLRDATATEDVLQEVSVAAVRCAKDFAESEAKRWLYQVAIRQTILLRRNQTRHESKLRSLGEMRPVTDPAGYLDWLCDGERNEQLHQAMRYLKASDRQVLLLKYCEDYSCAEIAVHFGVTETTIQSRLLRARRRLRAVLINEYEFEE